MSSLPRALLLGALWGWLPCGLVYSTLLWSASQGNALDSALLMLAFGLGTWPVLLATGLAAERVTACCADAAVRMAGGLLVILFGLWTLPGPHQHWLMGHTTSPVGVSRREASTFTTVARHTASPASRSYKDRPCGSELAREEAHHNADPDR